MEQVHASVSGRSVTRGGDALDVSLHDRELHQEVLWTALLMVAANESDGPLAPHVVDDILDVVRLPRQPEATSREVLTGLRLPA